MVFMTKNCFLAIGLILVFWNICQNSETKGKTFLLCALLERAVEARSKSKIIHFCFHSFLKPFLWLWYARNSWRIFISTPASNMNHLLTFFFNINMKERNCPWWFVESRCVWDLLFPWLVQKLVSRLLPTQQYGKPLSSRNPSWQNCQLYLLNRQLFGGEILRTP